MGAKTETESECVYVTDCVCVSFALHLYITLCVCLLDMKMSLQEAGKFSWRNAKIALSQLPYLAIMKCGQR